jgi:rubrerythrin
MLITSKRDFHNNRTKHLNTLESSKGYTSKNIQRIIWVCLVCGQLCHTLPKVSRLN